MIRAFGPVQTIRYSSGKLLRMAAFCAIGLPLISPVFIATGPAAVILIPLVLIGGPVCALFCIRRALGSRVAFQFGYEEVIASSLWSKTTALPADLLDIRIDRDVAMLYGFLPVSKKTYLTVVLRGRLFGTRTKRMAFNLLEPSPEEAADIVGALRHEIASRNLAETPLAMRRPSF